MPKQCSHPFCTWNVFAKGLCPQHWRNVYGKPIFHHPKLKQTEGNGVAKPIKAISDKQAKRLAKYRIARDEYFKEQPVCEFPGCCSTDITCHHSAGKIGSLLWNKKYFKSLCWPHHKFCEENPTKAKELNLSVDRLDK